MPVDATAALLERVFPETPEAWRDAELAKSWERVLALRQAVTGALEIARRDKLIGSSLEARVDIYAEDAAYAWPFGDELPVEDVMITSAAGLHLGETGPADAFRSGEPPGVCVSVSRAPGRKCARSWKVSPDVGSDPRHPDLTPRDADAVVAWDAEHARHGAGA